MKPGSLELYSSHVASIVYIEMGMGSNPHHI
jgi:hypothetical protein